jgi:hypothetical protein
MPSPTPRRARGAQPGNKNALKHGRYTRIRRQVREFEEFLRLHHYDALLTGDRRVLNRYKPIIERLEREKAELSQAVFDQRLRDGSTSRWILDEIARAGRENGAQEIE